MIATDPIEQAYLAGYNYLTSRNPFLALTTLWVEWEISWYQGFHDRQKADEESALSSALSEVA